MSVKLPACVSTPSSGPRILCGFRARRSAHIHQIRGGQIEIQIDERRHQRRDHERPGGIQPHAHRQGRDLNALAVTDVRGRDRGHRHPGAVIDLDVGVGVVEVQRRADVVARRDRDRRHKLGQVHEPGEIHSRSQRQGLDHRAVGFGQGKGVDVDRVAEEIPGRVGQTDTDHALFIGYFFAGVQAQSHRRTEGEGREQPKERAPVSETP